MRKMFCDGCNKILSDETTWERFRNLELCKKCYESVMDAVSEVINQIRKKSEPLLIDTNEESIYYKEEKGWEYVVI